MILVVESELIDAKNHLDDLLKLEEGLTPWELKFVESMSHTWYPYSRKQVDMIFKIWRVRC